MKKASRAKSPLVIELSGEVWKEVRYTAGPKRCGLRRVRGTRKARIIDPYYFKEFIKNLRYPWYGEGDKSPEGVLLWAAQKRLAKVAERVWKRWIKADPSQAPLSVLALSEKWRSDLHDSRSACPDVEVAYVIPIHACLKESLAILQETAKVLYGDTEGRPLWERITNFLKRTDFDR